MSWLLLLGSAWATPFRGPLAKPPAVLWEPGRDPRVLMVKLGDGAVDGELAVLLASCGPAFHREPDVLRADRETFDPEHRLADLSTWYRCEGSGLGALGDRLLGFDRVSTAYFDFAPVEPPQDIPPETPDLTGYQAYLGSPPDGLGFDEAVSWPGGTGANVAVADVEYGWDPDHEDLEATRSATVWGWDSGDWAYHGTSVLGELVAGDNGYGVTGMVPDAEVVVVSPYPEADLYNVAAAIDGAAALLDAGDVLLIEQQAWAHGNYAPVEVSPVVFDAIALAVAKGIVVVEPAGNGAQDLDDEVWDGWFDREQQDSGAIIVGGGAPPDSWQDARTWDAYGSCYGSRVDLQGWYEGIATTANGDFSPDLFFPDGDGLQGYTSQFGGTSGASPMIAAAAAVANSVAWELWGQPWDPMDLRAALVSTGTPQPPDDPYLIGPQPNLRVFLRTWGAR